MNRLAKEKSPYLLQHAENPVDWHPWGDAAFEKAKRENKPIFLSIGYSTCHWCHVMAHESFEDSNVAKLMNDAFVSIKVDREERPDIDSTYMTVCQILTGRGGWPLTILMTPEKKPFFAGTYFPKESRFNVMGMIDLIPRIKTLWKTRRDEIARSAEEIVHQLHEVHDHPPSEALGAGTLDLAYSQLDQRFDEGYGGFGNAPKFPTPHNFLFLLRTWKRTGNKRALRMVERSLQMMRFGGIYDQVGFGFHRYSADREWFVPHFEKMLYDQAMLTLAYTETFQVTRKLEYAQTLREIIEYVLRDLKDPAGAFLSSEDADSEGEEGKFYVWEQSEIEELLSPEEAVFAKSLFGIKPAGNFHEEASGRQTGRNILALANPDEISNPLFQLVRKKLFGSRGKRIRPHRDDKILTDWNGLMIGALAKASGALHEPSYSQAADSALKFILSHLKKNGRLLHRYRDGESAVPGFLEDYAFLIWGLLELYEATFKVEHLNQALNLNDMLIQHFWDETHGGFYLTADDAEQVLTRSKDVYDGAIPSGNSVAFLNLLRLSRMTGRTDLEEKASRLSRYFSALISHAPAGYTQFLCSLDFALGSREVVIVGDPRNSDTQEMIRIARDGYYPNQVVLLKSGESDPIAEIASFTKDFKLLDGKSTAYVCKNHACSSPQTDPAKLRDLVEQF